MKQPTRPARKPPVFVRCPVCGAEIWLSRGQRWCSRQCAQEAKHSAGAASPEQKRNRPIMFVLTPDGRFWGMSSAARHHNVSRTTVERRIRKGCPGWQFEAPDQIPAGFVPSDRARRGRRKREDQL
jgi:hypothetical protein